MKLENELNDYSVEVKRKEPYFNVYYQTVTVLPETLNKLGA